MKRTTVWVDHNKAYIFDYQVDGVHERTLEPKHNVHPSKESLRKFYHELAHSVQGAESILVLGPGQAKEEFKNHCEEHHSSVDKAIFKVESMKDHPTQEQILKVSNEFFKKEMNWKGI